MSKINNHAMGMFSNNLAAWKVRVKAVIKKNHPWSKIKADNLTLTKEDFKKFKDLR
jgi:hypothetical protein